MAHITIFKNETLSLTKEANKEDYWLYDKIRGQNIAMRAKTEQEAFIMALTNYQKRLSEVTKELDSLQSKVDSFIETLS